MPSRGGYQPETQSPSARRADFDLQRRIAKVEQTGGGGGVPPGGTTGQVLTKKSSADGDVEWKTPTAGGGSIAYTHYQSTVSSSWSIPHMLGWYPNVTVIDSGGTTVEGDVTQVNVNSMMITFSGGFTGVAYLS